MLSTILAITLMLASWHDNRIVFVEGFVTASNKKSRSRHRSISSRFIINYHHDCHLYTTYSRRNNMIADENTDNDNDDNHNESFDLKGFNPLNYSPKSLSSRQYGTRISTRSTIMQQLNQELLDAIETLDDQQTQKVLQEYKDFLLEPLENQNAAMDAGSIYSPNMSRSERFQVYRKSMHERIESSTNPKVKKILESMKNFVLQFE